MKRILFSVIFLFVSSISYSQQLLGKWTGILSQNINGNFYVELNINEIHGDTFTGTASSTAFTGPFRGKALFRVTLRKQKDGSIYYVDEGIIDSTIQKTTLYWCRKTANLQLHPEKDSLVISGAWSSPNCPSGTIILKRALNHQRTIGGEADVRVRSRHLTLQVWDFDALDEDSVSLMLNGKQVGPARMMLPAYRIYGSPAFTFPLNLNSGDNVLEILAVNEGIKPLNTIGLLIMDEDSSQKYYFSLKAKESALIHFLRI